KKSQETSGFVETSGLKSGMEIRPATSLPSGPASISATLYPALARFTASGPPPGPDPTTMESTCWSAARAPPEARAAAPAANFAERLTNSLRETPEGEDLPFVADKSTPPQLWVLTRPNQTLCK